MAEQLNVLSILTAIAERAAKRKIEYSSRLEVAKHLERPQLNRTRASTKQSLLDTWKSTPQYRGSWRLSEDGKAIFDSQLLG